MTEKRFTRIVSALERRQPDLTVVMDRVHKVHNLAAVTRTCDAVGIPEIHAVASENILNLKRNVAKGCHKWVAIKAYSTITEALDHLRANEFSIIATSPDEQATDFRCIDFTKKVALLVGNELGGLSQEVIAEADERLFVPLHGMVASLNVSVATGIILYEAEKQRLAAGFYKNRRLEETRFRKLLFEWAYPRVSEYCRKHAIAYPALDKSGNFNALLTHQKRIR